MSKDENPNENDTLVIVYYPSVDEAQATAARLKEWDEAKDDIKLGAIGVVTLDENGRLQVDEIGQRNVKSGALWGTAIGASIGFLTAGIGFIPGLLAGAAIGGGIGAFDHKGLGMSDHDKQVLTNNLKAGGAALGVMCDEYEVYSTREFMTRDTGVASHWTMPQETSAAINAAAKAQAAATTAVDDAVAEAAAADAAPADEKATALSAIVASGTFGAADAQKLVDAGVEKPSALLAMGATPAGRSELAAVCGLDEDAILAAVKMMDLMRIDGVGVVYARLLQAAGVETVPDLARRNPENLALKLAEVNESAAITDQVPSAELVAGWVGQANELPRMINY